MTLYLNFYLVPSHLVPHQLASTQGTSHELSPTQISEQQGYTTSTSLLLEKQACDKSSADLKSNSLTSSKLGYLTTLRSRQTFFQLLFHRDATFEIEQHGSTTAIQHGNTNLKNISNEINEEIPNLVIAFDVLSGSFNIQETSSAALIINNSWNQDPGQMMGQIELRDEIKSLKISHNPCYFAVCVKSKVPTIEDPTIHPMYQEMSAELKTKIFLLELFHLQN